MKKHIFSYSIMSMFIIALMGTNRAGAQQLFKNGDFNATTANYTTGCTSIEATYYESTYGGSSATNHVAEVDDESCFYQDVCILPGASYTFAMDASRRTTGSPNPLISHIKITGLDASSATVATYVDMNYTRTNTTFAFTPVTGIPTINVAAGSGVVRLRIALTDSTAGYSTLGMIVDNLSLTFASTPFVLGAPTLCQNTGYTFSVSGVGSTGVNYAWSFGASASPVTSTISNPTASWSTTGTQTVTVALGNAVCWVDTLTYSLNVNGAMNVVRYDSVCSNTTYNFGGAMLNHTGTYTDSFVAVTGCDSIVTLNLYVKQMPAAPGIIADTVYCLGETYVPITVSGPGALWYTSATGGTGSPTDPGVNTSATGSTTYWVSLTNMGCEGPRTEITTSVYNNALAGFSFDIHTGCARDTITFTNNSQYASSYGWDFGNGVIFHDQSLNPVHFFQPVVTPTDVLVKVHAYSVQCLEDSAGQIITIPPSVFPKFLTGVTPDQVINHGTSVQLDARGAVYYYWTPNDGHMTNPNINNPLVTPDDSTVYTVYGYDGQGCRDSATVTIAIRYNDPIFIPSGFTPNNDGMNDIFRITHLKYTKLVDFNIYNKWGQLIFQTSDITKGWDGTFEGAPQDIGVYKYLIITSQADGGNHTYTGDVTLIR